MPGLGRPLISILCFVSGLPREVSARAFSSLFDGERNRYIHAPGFGPFPEDHEPSFDDGGTQFKSGTSYFKRADQGKSGTSPGPVIGAAIGGILAFVALLVGLWFLVHYLMRRRLTTPTSSRPVLKVQINVDSREDSDVSPWTAVDKSRTPLAAFLRSPFSASRRASRSFPPRAPPTSLAAAQVDLRGLDKALSDWSGPPSDRPRRTSSDSMAKGIHLDIDLAGPFHYTTSDVGLDMASDPFASPPQSPPAPMTTRPTLTVPLPTKRASLVADELSPAYSVSSLYSPIATELSQARRITLSAHAASSLVNGPQPHTFPPEPVPALVREPSQASRRASRSLAKDVAQRNMLARAQAGDEDPTHQFHPAARLASK